MWQELPGVLDQAKDAKALLLSGADDHFSAGADLSEMAALQNNPAKAAKFRTEMQNALHALAHHRAPTIAHISGSCFGAGAALIMACDLRFGDPSARFCIPPAKLGLLYPHQDLTRLQALIGPAKAKEFLFTADVWDANTAHQNGLINNIQSAEQSQHVINNILQNSAEAICQLKQMLNGTLPDPDAQFDARFQAKDFAAAISSFAQKP